MGRVAGPLRRQDWPPAVIDALNSFSIKQRPCADRFTPSFRGRWVTAPTNEDLIELNRKARVMGGTENVTL